ncbi:MAG: hypothetical protein V1790_11595, partial [Planctomycetota bacterium]
LLRLGLSIAHTSCPICGSKPCAHFIRPTSPHLSVTRPQPHPGDDCFKDYRPDERLFCNIVGGVSSPLLSNVLLTPFDREMRCRGYQRRRIQRWLSVFREDIAGHHAALRVSGTPLACGPPPAGSPCARDGHIPRRYMAKNLRNSPGIPGNFA